MAPDMGIIVSQQTDTMPLGGPTWKVHCWLQVPV